MMLAASHHFIRKPSRETGFGLIELMVAILIGLFIVAGVIGLVITMKGSFNTQDQLSRVQESERFALTVLDNTVRAAGYFTNPTAYTASTALATTAANPDGTVYAPGEGISGTTGASTASDTINVRFQSASGDGLMNCLGDSNTSGSVTVWSNSFAINAAHQLTCTVTTDGGTPGTPTVLVDNVLSMKILYGVDTDMDSGRSADTYLTSTGVVAGNYWPSVISVRIILTFQDLINSTPNNPVGVSQVIHVVNLMNRP